MWLLLRAGVSFLPYLSPLPGINEQTDCLSTATMLTLSISIRDHCHSIASLITPSSHLPTLRLWPSHPLPPSPALPRPKTSPPLSLPIHRCLHPILVHLPLLARHPNPRHPRRTSAPWARCAHSSQSYLFHRPCSLPRHLWPRRSYYQRPILCQRCGWESVHGAGNG